MIGLVSRAALSCYAPRRNYGFEKTSQLTLPVGMQKTRRYQYQCVLSQV